MSLASTQPGHDEAILVAEEALHATAASPPPVAPASVDLLDQIIAATDAPSGNWLDAFLAEPSLGRGLGQWVARSAPQRQLQTPRQLSLLLTRDIARLDQMISDMVNAIIHHPRFQQLEASWRGLRYLVDRTDADESILIRILNVSWKELVRDLDRAVEFDQSQLFQKVYSEEFGTPGGKPFGVLLGDYYIRRGMDAEHPTDDVAALTAISQVAAAAFAPFVAGAEPELLGLSDYSHLERPINLARTFDQPEYLKWRALRDSEDARFIGLTLPRILMRLPYADDGSRNDGFRFREETEAADRSGYLWGNAVYAFGAVLMRAFAESGWMAEIRGFQRDSDSGGLVSQLPVHYFPTDRSGVAPRFPTEVAIADLRDKDLADLGFMPLAHCKDTELCVFYSNQSLQKPKTYDNPAATTNARMSAMLQYMLCVSRFAHYLKMLARDKLGSFSEPGQLEDQLRNWIQTYVANDTNASAEVRARYPLREAEVQVLEMPGKPGSYQVVCHLLPHSQMDALTVGIKLRTELTPVRT